MTLKGWSFPLPKDIEEAVLAGKLKVTTLVFKGIEIELLQGEIQREHMKVSFK